jgi:hypothetical protein
MLFNNLAALASASLNIAPSVPSSHATPLQNHNST